MNTKEKILSKALELFNTEGVENITTRHIAKEINMSQGNLHYHYPNKNALITRLYEDFFDEIRNVERYNSGSLFAKEDVLKSMEDSFKIMFRYRFFFIDNAVVWRRLPEVKTNIILLLEAKKNEIREIIQSYKNQGIFRSGISDEQMNYLAEQFIFLISSWLNASEYLPNTSNVAKQYAQFTFRNWLPYLNDQEMKEWEAIL
ncbi:MAG: TetR/AcrR family transcriptional regulator [Cyclobacteriaceae bacterium]